MRSSIARRRPASGRTASWPSTCSGSSRTRSRRSPPTKPRGRVPERRDPRRERFDNAPRPGVASPQRRCHMVNGTYKVLDSDIHIIEPADLWTRYIDSAFRDRAPTGLTEDAGDLRLAHDGKAWGRVAIDAD